MDGQTCPTRRPWLICCLVTSELVTSFVKKFAYVLSYMKSTLIGKKEFFPEVTRSVNPWFLRQFSDQDQFSYCFVIHASLCSCYDITEHIRKFGEKWNGLYIFAISDYFLTITINLIISFTYDCSLLLLF